MHDDELRVDDDVVRRLLRRDVPALAGLPLRRLAVTGSSNALFRLGKDLLVRLPRQPGGSASILAEARWGGLLASRLPVPVPEVVGLGRPDDGYPEQWSVVRWIQGVTPAVPMPPGPATTRLARNLGEVVGAVHALPVPEEALADPALRSYRAGPLRDVHDEIAGWLARCREVPGLRLDLDAADQYWGSVSGLPEPDTEPAWVHTDLLAENVLVRASDPALPAGGEVAALLDLGGLAVGRRAVGLISAWELFEAADRDVFRNAAGASEEEWQVGRAWAFAIAVMTFPYYWQTMPERCAQRLVMAQTVLDDPER